MLQSNVIQISFIVLNIILSGLCYESHNNTDSYTCKPEHKLSVQPMRKELSKVTKCCRMEENIYATNNASTTYICNRNVYPTILTTIVTVELFVDCIMFWNRSNDLLPIEIIGYPPDHLFSTCLYFGDVYGSHIIQNGSLLVTNTYGHFNYKLHNDYCLDVNAQTGVHMVCYDIEKVPPDQRLPHLAQSDNSISKIFIIISIPCFVGITLLYLINKDFRNLHGACVITLSIFMTVEFLLQSILNYSSEDLERLWKFVHYLSFVHYFWLLVIFTNGLLFVWIYLPYNILEWRLFGICSYLGFFVFCMTVPKLIADRIRDDELVSIVEFLTTPKTTIVLTCLLLLMLTFIGSNRLTLSFKQDIFQKYYKHAPGENDVDIIRYHYQIEEVQNRLTCLTSLAGFMVILQVFCMPGHAFLIFMREILNSLQGVVLILIFIGLRFREIRSFAVSRLKK